MVNYSVELKVTRYEIIAEKKDRYGNVETAGEYTSKEQVNVTTSCDDAESVANTVAALIAATVR